MTVTLGCLLTLPQPANSQALGYSGPDASSLEVIMGAVYAGKYGVVCDGAAVSTVKLQSAVDATQLLSLGTGGGALYLPAGICKINADITIGNGGITIIGSGQGAGAVQGGTTIRDTRTTGWTFNVASQLPVVFRDLAIDSNPNYKTAGGCIKIDGTGANWNTRSRVENVWCRGAYDGIELVTTTDFAISKSYIIDYSHNGLQLTGNAALETGSYRITETAFFNQNRKYDGILAMNPFTTANGSATVSVHSPAHLLVSGMVAVFTNASTVNGINPNGNYTVTVTGPDDFAITASVMASGSGGGGGTPYYWYGSNAGVELNGGNDTRLTDNKFIGNCWNFLMRPLKIGGGDGVIKGNVLDQFHCASVAFVQGIPGQEASSWEIGLNKFSMLPGQYGATAPANQPTIAAFYIGPGTPTTSPRWINNLVIATNTFRNAVTAAVPMVDIEDGNAISLGPNSFTNLNISGMTGIKIGAGATNVVQAANDSYWGIPSGFQNP